MERNRNTHPVQGRKGALRPNKIPATELKSAQPNVLPVKNSPTPARLVVRTPNGSPFRIQALGRVVERV